MTPEPVKFPNPSHDAHAQEPDVLLALTVLGEARGEEALGRSAVAHVVKNRMAKSGRSVADTVLAKWQFSCWNHADPNRLFLEDTIAKGAKNVPMATWLACWVAAVEALFGDSPDPTGGATHYCTKNLWAVPSAGRPKWHDAEEIGSGRTVETARIGNHVFARAK